MTKAQVRASKKLLIRRINEILEDYLMDENETGAIIDLQFFRGEETQCKHLVWSKPHSRKAPIKYKAVCLSELDNQS